MTSERPRDHVRYSYGYGSTPSFQAAQYEEQLYSHELDRLHQATTGNDGFSTYSDFNKNRQSRQTMPSRLSSGRLSTLVGDMDDSTPLSTLMGQGAPKDASEKEFDPEAPTISKTDWIAGESKKEHYRKREQRKAKAATAAGRARDNCADAWSRCWKRILIGLAVLLVCLALILAFTIPRVPTIAFSSSAPLTSTDANPYVSSADPTEFYWNSNFSLAIDAHASYVPVKFTEFHVTVRDYQTAAVIGTGNKTMSVNGRKTSDVLVPVYFYGTFTDDTDATYLNMREACVHLWTGSTRPALNVTMSITSKILGRIGTYTSERLVATNLTCPIQFSASAA